MLSLFFLRLNTFSLSYSNIPVYSYFCGAYQIRATSSVPPRKILTEPMHSKRLIPSPRSECFHSFSWSDMGLFLQEEEGVSNAILCGFLKTLFQGLSNDGEQNIRNESVSCW